MMVVAMHDEAPDLSPLAPRRAQESVKAEPVQEVLEERKPHPTTHEEGRARPKPEPPNRMD